MTAELLGHIRSVNVGEVRTVEWSGRAVATAIWKEPVESAAAVRGVNLVGDDQADRRVHGGPDKAVYAYATEDYAWWEQTLGRAFPPGTFGENLTTAGIDLSAAVVGERWQIATTTLEVSQPRLPCFKLGMRMGDAAFVDRFEAAGRPGTYLRIVEPGEVVAGAAVTRVSIPAHGLRVADLLQSHHTRDPSLLQRVAGNDDVPESWRAAARRALGRLDRGTGSRPAN